MLNCDDAARYIARAADDPDGLDDTARAVLDAHLAICAGCRSALEGQRAVGSVLRDRPAQRVGPAFTARLAARLDAESGWFGIADWRAWTFRLAPVAAALLLGAFLSGTPNDSPAATLEDWTFGAAENAGATAVLWQADASPDWVLETILTGREAERNGGVNGVR